MKNNWVILLNLIGLTIGANELWANTPGKRTLEWVFQFSQRSAGSGFSTKLKNFTQGRYQLSLSEAKWDEGGIRMWQNDATLHNLLSQLIAEELQDVRKRGDSDGERVLKEFKHLQINQIQAELHYATVPSIQLLRRIYAVPTGLDKISVKKPVTWSTGFE